MQIISRAVAGLAVGAAIMAGSAAPSFAAKNYGCFKVTAEELNIRDRPYSDAKVIGTAGKGEIVEKRKWLCTLRGYWCAIRKGSVEGYADKNFMEKVTCP
ncbi:MAG: hypothetical protein ACT4N2_02490 [Hyphomicrobium sp.]